MSLPNEHDPRRTSRAAVALGAAGVLTGAGNFAFNVVVARQTGAQLYGALGALLSVATIAGVVATAVTYAVAQVVVRERVIGGAALSRSVIAIAPWMVLGALGLCCADELAAYLHLSSAVPVTLTVLFGTGMIALGVPVGVLLGCGRTTAIAVLTVATPVLRLLLDMVLVHVIPPLDAATAASVLSVGLTGAAACAAVMRPVRGGFGVTGSAEITSQPLVRESFIGSLLTAGLFALWTLPTALGRHLLPSAEAGDLAAGQLVATAIVVYLAGPLITAYYPAVARTRDIRVVRRALQSTFVVSAVGAVSITVAAPTAIHLLYGGGFDVTPALVACCGLSACAVACASCVAWMSRAMESFRLVVALWVAAALLGELAIASLWHPGASLLAAAPFVCMLCALPLAVTLAFLGRTLTRLRWPALPRIAQPEPAEP